MRLREFVIESNRIEGIVREPTAGEIEAHEWFLAEGRIMVTSLEEFVALVASRPLRRAVGMDVFVGDHRPPPGGPDIEVALDALLAAIQASYLTPYEAHVRYETLHPFMDGNGRSGRVLWAWHMQRIGLDPFSLPFLHRFYYQALSGSRSAHPEP